jgi:cytosine/adenosine deaminase-related metal-dependent hydrolase
LVELYQSGALDGRETINHGTFISRDKMDAVVAHGAKVNVCPRIESQFRFGDIPYQAWLDAGLKPAISNDDPATYAIDMFHEMQTLYSFQRAKVHNAVLRGEQGTPRLATVRNMLEAATLRGAENCNLAHRVGSLTPGKAADIVMIDTANIHLFPRHNAFCTVVEGANVNSVDTVFLNGRIRKWRGKLVGVDFARLRAAIESSRDYLFREAGWPHETIDLMD